MTVRLAKLKWVDRTILFIMNSKSINQSNSVTWKYICGWERKEKVVGAEN